MLIFGGGLASDRNSNSIGGLQPVYDGEEGTTRLKVALLPFGTLAAASEAFDEEVEAIMPPFIIPAAEPSPAG